MATSGTVGQTVISVATLIDHSLRRAGIPAAKVTTDIQRAARENLFFYLCTMANAGINIWTIEKTITGYVSGKQVYQMPVGTIEILNALYRTVTLPQDGTAYSSAGGTAANAFDQDIETACTQTSINGYISYQWTTAVSITSVGIMSNVERDYTLAWEASDDGITWVEILSSEAQTYPDRDWVYFDINASRSMSYFRVRETGGAILNVREVVFGQNPYTIPMARMNMDDYTNLVNTTFQQRQITQYWFRRELAQPTINLWPVPNYNFDQMVFWRTRQIQDVGALTDEIEMPQRWFEALVCEIALRMVMEIPDADLNRIPILQSMAEKASLAANDEERDKSPINLTPNIGPYTVR